MLECGAGTGVEIEAGQIAKAETDMNLSAGELKFLSAAMALHIAGGGAAVRVDLLRGIFRRIGELNSVRDQLVIGGFIAHDPHRGELCVLPDRVWQALNQYGVTPELFPKDDFVSAMGEVSASNLTKLCQLTRTKDPAGINNFAPVPPKPKPPDPPPPIENPSRLCGALRTFAGENLAENFAGTLRKTGALPAQIHSLKEKHKGIKPLQDFETLSRALHDVSLGDEPAAYEAMCGILGGVVMEGGDLDGRGELRYGDGGKWRNRWTTNRARTHSVLAELVAQLKEGSVKSRGGKAEDLWKEFSNVKKA